MSEEEGETTASEAPTRFPTYRILGRSGLRVHPLCLGTMTFALEPDDIYGQWVGSYTPPDEGEQIMLQYFQMGGNFIDTANAYQRGRSEEFVAHVLGKNQIDRDEMVIATKYSLSMYDGPNGIGNHRKSMYRAVEDSLKRLNTSYIDLFYVHWWDWTLDVAEVMRALNDLVRAGKILHIGFSDTPAWVTAMANASADKFGWEPITAYQGRYSLVDRGMDQELFPMLRYANMGGVTWGTIGQGKLSGRRTRADPTGAGAGAQRKNVPISEEDFKVIDVVREIAEAKGRSCPQIALRWAIQRPGLTSAIVGARALRHWVDNVAVMEFELSGEEMERLDEVSKRTPIFPHDIVSDHYSTNSCFKFLVKPEKSYTIE